MNFGWTWRNGWGERLGSLRGYAIGRTGPPTVLIEAVLAPSATAAYPVNLPLASLSALCLWADRRVSVSRGAGGTNEQQTLSITGGPPTTDSVVVRYAAGNTGPIPYNATASQVQSAYEAASWIAPGDVACTGGPWPGTPVVVTFQGLLAAADIADATPPHLYGAGFMGTAVVAESVKGAAGTTADTLTLNCAVPLAWHAGSAHACPFTADVSSLAVVNLDASRNARIRLAFDLE